jgi:hypothetical protein
MGSYDYDDYDGVLSFCTGCMALFLIASFRHRDGTVSTLRNRIFLFFLIFRMSKDRTLFLT